MLPPEGSGRRGKMLGLPAGGGGQLVAPASPLDGQLPSGRGWAGSRWWGTGSGGVSSEAEARAAGVVEGCSVVCRLAQRDSWVQTCE